MNKESIKVIFLDVKDTLGYVDSPGHLVTFKPSTLQFLQAIKNEMGIRIGIITNLPENIDHQKGVKMLEEAGILEYVAKEDIVSSHEAKANKPSPSIYKFACKKLDVIPQEALFVGENLLEVLGAQSAGLNAMIKPFPPRRDFLFKPIPSSKGSQQNSGRLSEVLMEEDHLIGKRIVIVAAKMSEQISKKNKSSVSALGTLIYLLFNYVDKFHHAKEESILLPFAISKGYPSEKTLWITLEHDQGRSYFKAIDIAYKRVLNNDPTAWLDVKLNLDGFVNLYKHHGAQEDNEFLPQVTALFTDLDDAMVVDLFANAGPADLTPYLTLIAQMENELESNS